MLFKTSSFADRVFAIMKKVVWQTKSPVVFNSFNQGKLTGIPKGGNSYNFFAARALSTHFDFSIDKNSVKKSGEPNMSYYLRMSALRPTADVIIKEGYPAALSPVSKKVKNVAIIHHIDEVLSKRSYRHYWFYKKLIKKLPKMDLVITVSRYWEEHLRNLGCKNVKVIYNSFDLDEFKITDEEVNAFKKKYSLGSKPLIYIGNAHKQKGVYETYEALKNSGYEMVMTGAKNEAVDLPVKFLSLDRKDFITLLKATDVVVIMSKLPEGWNRIAHEALLCRTPVIGSGVGGMKELLQEGSQIILTDIKDLEEKIKYALLNKKELTEKGYTFVCKYTQAYFNAEWISTIETLTNLS